MFFILGFGPLLLLFLHLYMKDILILVGFLALVGVIFSGKIPDCQVPLVGHFLTD